MLKSIVLLPLFSACALFAQPKLGPANLNAGWLWPKGVYTLVLHDGPGPKTEAIAEFLAKTNKTADFFQVFCHYSGQPGADPRSAMCNQQHAVPMIQASRILDLHQCIGNHGQDHLNTATLTKSDTVYQIGGPTGFLRPLWNTANCPALLTFPGFQTDNQHNTWLNDDVDNSGRQQGPIWADFDGSGTIQTPAGPVPVGNDQECFAKGFNQQQCVAVMLGEMAKAKHGGIVNVHDFTPYAFNPMDPNEPKSNYAYDYVVAIINGCQAANNGTACVWLPPDAIPGVHRSHSLNRFAAVSDPSDDFSDRSADILTGDLNADSFADVIVPRKDGLYCAMNQGNGAFYPLARCLGISEANMRASRYWLVDVEGDGLPYVLWISGSGLMAVKANGHGGFEAEARNLSPEFSESNLRARGIYSNSIRFGQVRAGRTVPDLLAMSSTGVMISHYNGRGFDAPRPIPHLTFRAEDKAAWSPQYAGKRMMLIDVTGRGAEDIVIPGNQGLLYAAPVSNTFAGFKPLLGKGSFDHWAQSHFYTSFTTTRIAGKPAIAGWTPVGVSYSHLSMSERHPMVEQFQTLCSDCFASLPGWLDEWHKNGMTSAALCSGFADFKNDGLPQAYAVWGKSLYTGSVSSLAGY